MKVMLNNFQGEFKKKSWFHVNRAKIRWSMIQVCMVFRKNLKKQFGHTSMENRFKYKI
jgi:hypothetical protein